MSAEKNNNAGQQNDRPDPQTAPVAPNQARENLVRVYVLSNREKNVSAHPQISIMFRNFHEDNEGLINRQINLELYASYVYTAMAHHFDRWDVALKGKYEKNKVVNLLINICSFFLGHHKFFKKMAEEEHEHANKFMEYQNKRGGTIVLLDIKVCRRTFSFKIKIKQRDYIRVVETSSTKLGFCIGSSSNGITIGKRCLSSIIRIT